MSPAKFKCKQCGAELEFGAGTASLVCPYCGCANEIQGQGPVSASEQKEINFNDYLQQYEENLGATEVVLDDADLAAIATALDATPIAGDRYPAHLQARVGR